MESKILSLIEIYSKSSNVKVNEKQKKIIVKFCLENPEDIEKDVKRFVETVSSIK